MIKRTMGAGMPFLSGRMTFMAPDNGANASAGTGGQGNQQPATGATGAAGETSQQQQQQQQSPWDNVNFDEMDESTRRVMEAARADHQRVAGENATLRQQQETRQREDQQRQQQQQQQQHQQQQQQPDAVTEHVRKTLKARGFTDAQIDQQAPVFGDLLNGMLPVIREQLGRDLGPLANTVIGHENENNFETAFNTEAGQRIFGNQEIAQEVWNIVQQRTTAGQTFTTEAILNLGKMIFFDKGGETSQQQQQQQQQPSATGSSFFPTVNRPVVNRSTGSFTFPGAGGFRPTTAGANTGPGPKHAVNDDTRVALATTFGELARTTGVAPKDFPSDLARTGAGARKK